MRKFISRQIYRFVSYKAARDFSRAMRNFKDLFRNVPTWASLQTLGQSSLISLTVAAPFIGWLILFNGEIVRLLELSPKVLSSWLGHATEGDSKAIEAISISRIQITYFGLVFVGFASGLFKIFCPSDVRKYKTISEYIEGEKPLITNARRNILIWEIANDYMSNHYEKDDFFEQSYLQQVAYPTSLQTLFHTVVEEITEAVEATEDIESTDGSQEGNVTPNEIDHDPFAIRVGPRSAIDSGRVARILWAQQSVFRALWASFNFVSKDYLTDLLALRYNGLIYSKPFVRIIITLFYGIGFSILLYPTINTFGLVVLRTAGIGP